VGLWDFNDDLEEIGENERLIRLSDFSGGVGTRWRREHQGDLKSMYGYWYGYLDTWSPGVVHLPLLSTADTPTGISDSQTDYVSIIECYINGSWYVVLVKGENLWITSGDAFGAAVKTVAGAKGRQLLDCFFGGNDTRALVWICGASVTVQFSTIGTSNWNQLGATGVACLCGWNMADIAGVWSLFAIRASNNMVYHSDNASTLAVGNLGVLQVVIPPATPTGVIPLGNLGDPLDYYLANGPDIWVFSTSGGINAITAILPTGLRDVTAGGKYEDRFALTDGSHRIILWHPTQPPIDVSLFGDDGVPDAIRGGVKALYAVGPYLLALWQMDNNAPVAATNRGNSMVYWCRPNLQGQTTWHPRSGVISCGFPFSIGSPMVMAEKTVENKRRLWIAGVNTASSPDVGVAYYQDHPLAGFNPMADTASTYRFEDGPKRIYLSWRGLQLMGDEAGAMIAAECDGDLSATECVQLGYRANYEALGEENTNAGWDTLQKFTSVSRNKFGGENGVQAQAVQPYLEFERGDPAMTPKLRSAGILVHRCRRQPSMEAQ
jgi:hypothetical protein